MQTLENGTVETPAPGLAEDMRAREQMYRLIAGLYRRELEDADLDALHGALFPADSGSADMDRGFELIATYMSNLWCESVEELRVDYARCFVGHGQDTYGAAFPFENVYTSKKRLLMQDARDEVLAIYRASGLDKDESWREGEDHIALELEFMATMAQRCADALESGDTKAAGSLLQTQRNFLSDHLLRWVPLMTKELRTFAKTDMYLGLSYLTDGFLADDGKYLKEVSVA